MRWVFVMVVISVVLTGVFYLNNLKKETMPVMQKIPQVIVKTDNKSDLIRVASVKQNDIVKSPLTVRGEARGNWFFEASFPVRLYDASGKELAALPAQAQGEWMTTEFVPFEATLEFQAPSTGTGTLVLEKDNPSGLPEHADALAIPVRFR